MEKNDVIEQEKNLPSKYKPIRDRINVATGKVKVFLLHEQKEKEVFAVDAKEMIDMGAATLEPIEVVGQKGRIKIPQDQLDKYLTKGYKLVGQESEQGSIFDMTVSELKKLAESEGVDIANLSKKADIIEAIEKARSEKTETKEESTETEE